MSARPRGDQRAAAEADAAVETASADRVYGAFYARP